MLCTVQHLRGFALQASDDSLGCVDDIFFDDVRWAARYFVVDTGNWLNERLVLISPVAVGEPDWSAELLPVALSTKQVEDSPPIGTDEPMERHLEHKLVSHFAWPAYWSDDLPVGRGFSEAATLGSTQPSKDEGAESVLSEQRTPDPHLRSAHDVAGYQVNGTDGEVGHVEDLIVDVENWSIRYIIVDTRRFLPGKHVIVSPDWIDDMDWSRRRMTLDVTSEMFNKAPAYEAGQEIDRDCEKKLYDHFGRTPYWSSTSTIS